MVNHVKLLSNVKTLNNWLLMMEMHISLIVCFFFFVLLLRLVFKARKLRVYVGPWIEEVMIDHANVDPVAKHLWYLKMKRLAPDQLTEVDLPLTMVGLLGCPAYLQGAQVELAAPTVKVEVIGTEIPPPLIVDVSNLKYIAPSTSLYLRDLNDQLPKNGSVRFSRNLDVNSTEIAWAYMAGRIPELKLDASYEDPNFLGPKRRHKYMLTYKNYWPKQW